jgi:hypothetical protein
MEPPDCWCRREIQSRWSAPFVGSFTIRHGQPIWGGQAGGELLHVLQPGG